jgi:hypothetical protein
VCFERSATAFVELDQGFGHTLHLIFLTPVKGVTPLVGFAMAHREVVFQYGAGVKTVPAAAWETPCIPSRRSGMCTEVRQAGWAKT